LFAQIQPLPNKKADMPPKVAKKKLKIVFCLKEIRFWLTILAKSTILGKSGASDAEGSRRLYAEAVPTCGHSLCV
jgi:hypothetical protein